MNRINLKIVTSLICLFGLGAFFIWSLQYSIQLWHIPVPPEPVWISDWVPSQEGNITCVYTNLTLTNDTSYGGEEVYDLWGHTLNDSYCSSSTVLRYYRQIIHCPWCLPPNIMFQYTLPFNCSVNRNCTEFRKFFIEQPPANDTYGGISERTALLILLYFGNIGVFFLICAMIYIVYRLHQESKKLEVLRMLQ